MFFNHGGIISKFAQVNWKMPLQEKIKLFNWLVFNNGILPIENMKKRKWKLMENASPVVRGSAFTGIIS